jgi:sugar/nucleoside kinase (ribokinase family)
MLIGRGIDVSGLKTVPGGKTFRWTGKYHQNMNDRDTLEVHLNVLADFNPQLPESYRDSKFVFLGNAAPSTQLKVLEQVPNATLSVADTMDLWINIQRDELRQLLTKIDGLVLNDNEAKLLADDENLVRAGQKVLAMGPKFIVIKKGEHGAMFFSAKEKYMMPAYPTSQVVDPTGAGDSFAGGMMGYLAEQGKIEPRTLKHALAYGTVVASYNVEDFSLDRLKGLQRADVDRRFNEYREMLTF